MHVASGGLRGGQVLMDLLEFGVNGSLALRVLTVQALDELMSWLLTSRPAPVVASAGWEAMQPQPLRPLAN